MTEEEVLALAWDKNIEVHWAKSIRDLKKPGVHIMRPNYEQIIDSLLTAIANDCLKVYVYANNIIISDTKLLKY